MADVAPCWTSVEFQTDRAVTGASSSQLSSQRPDGGTCSLVPAPSDGTGLGAGAAQRVLIEVDM